MNKLKRFPNKVQEISKAQCTKEEIEAYQKFAALSLEERRRRVYERMIETMPDSPVTKDFLAGKIKLLKRRGRKKQQLGIKQRGRKALQQNSNCLKLEGLRNA
jgi:hypothetical protein